MPAFPVDCSWVLRGRELSARLHPRGVKAPVPGIIGRMSRLHFEDLQRTLCIRPLRRVGPHEAARPLWILARGPAIPSECG